VICVEIGKIAVQCGLVFYPPRHPVVLRSKLGY